MSVSIEDILSLYDQKGHSRTKRAPPFYEAYRKALFEKPLDYMELDHETIVAFKDKFKEYFKGESFKKLLSYIGLSAEFIETVQFLMIYGSLIGLVLYSGVYQYPLSFSKIILKEILDLFKRLIVVLWGKVLDWLPEIIIFVWKSVICLLRTVFLNHEQISSFFIELMRAFYKICRQTTIYMIILFIWVVSATKKLFKARKSFSKNIQTKILSQIKKGEALFGRLVGYVRINGEN